MDAAGDNTNPILMATTSAPPRLGGNSEAYLNMILQRYQNYHDQRTVMQERQVTHMRSYVASATDDLADAAYDRPLLRARYSERTPSVNRSTSATSSRSNRRSARDSRKMKFRYAVDPVLLVPCFTVSSRSARSARVSDVDVTAINFILALESVCTDHFRREQFYRGHRSSDEHPQQESGHLLMASALCLGSAPAIVFSRLEEIARSGTVTDYLRRHGSISWEGRGVSIKALKSMANTLNSGTKNGNSRDELELTPVQAWFELESVLVRTSSSGATRIDEGLMNALKYQLRGIITCAYYGAIMRRQHFNDVCADVMATRR